MMELITGIQSDKRPALSSGTHPVLKSIVKLGWEADPAKRPTMAEICTELSKVDWLVFGGVDAGRVRREAAGLLLSEVVWLVFGGADAQRVKLAVGLSLSQSVPKVVLEARLSETHARVC
jgi:hypothetical protein